MPPCLLLYFSTNKLIRLKVWRLSALAGRRPGSGISDSGPNLIKLGQDSDKGQDCPRSVTLERQLKATQQVQVQRGSNRAHLWLTSSLSHTERAHQDGKITWTRGTSNDHDEDDAIEIQIEAGAATYSSAAGRSDGENSRVHW